MDPADPVDPVVLTETVTFPNGVALNAGSLPVAAEGKALLMTVDGVVTEIQPGIYPGKVVLTVYELTHVPEDQAELSVGDFRTAIYVHDGQVQPTGIEFAAGDYQAADGALSGVRMKTAISDMNGIIVGGSGDKPFVISDSDFQCAGGGTSEGRGSNILTVGDAKVKLDGVKFWNHGTLTAICASGHSQVEIANSLIYGTRDFNAGKLCPWVLGINGSNRLTNAID